MELSCASLTQPPAKLSFRPISTSAKLDQPGTSRDATAATRCKSRLRTQYGSNPVDGNHRSPPERGLLLQLLTATESRSTEIAKQLAWLGRKRWSSLEPDSMLASCLSMCLARHGSASEFRVTRPRCKAY